MADGVDERPKVVSHLDATKVSGQGAWEQKRRLARAMRLVGVGHRYSSFSHAFAVRWSPGRSRRDSISSKVRL